VCRPLSVLQEDREIAYAQKSGRHTECACYFAAGRSTPRSNLPHLRSAFQARNWPLEPPSCTPFRLGGMIARSVQGAGANLPCHLREGRLRGAGCLIIGTNTTVVRCTMDTHPPGKPRRWQFSLRGMLAFTTCVAALLALYAWQAHVAERQQRAVASAIEQVRNKGGHFNKGQVNGTYSFVLQGCPVDDSALQRLAECLADFPGPHLDHEHDLHLFLDDTAVSDVGVAHLKGLNITHLSLKGTAVTDASIETLQTFVGMWRVDLRDTAITDGAIARLKKSLPHLEVSR